MSKLIIYQHRIYRTDLRRNPHLTYVFGDNEQRVGYGGQAKEMRDERNAFGFPTLTAPGLPWLEQDLDRIKRVINQHILRLRFDTSIGPIIVWPSDGIGTGLACMPEPILTHLNNELFLNLGVMNGPLRNLNK